MVLKKTLIKKYNDIVDEDGLAYSEGVLYYGLCDKDCRVHMYAYDLQSKKETELTSSFWLTTREYQHIYTHGNDVYFMLVNLKGKDKVQTAAILKLNKQTNKLDVLLEEPSRIYNFLYFSTDGYVYYHNEDISFPASFLYVISDFPQDPEKKCGIWRMKSDRSAAPQKLMDDEWKGIYYIGLTDKHVYSTSFTREKENNEIKEISSIYQYDLNTKIRKTMKETIAK